MRAIPVVVGLTALVGLVDAAGAQGVARKQLFVEGDLVRGAQQGAPGPFCVLSNQFKRLEKVVFRIRVLDATGNPLDDKGIKSLEVQLPDGQKLPSRYSAHPPRNPTDNFWTSAWIVPSGYPTGTDGQSQAWEPFKSKPSQLTVVDGQIEIKKP